MSKREESHPVSSRQGDLTRSKYYILPDEQLGPEPDEYSKNVFV